MARALQLVSAAEWRAWCSSSARPSNVPSAPDKVYKHDGWLGWGHWLGTGNTASGAGKCNVGPTAAKPQPSHGRARDNAVSTPRNTLLIRYWACSSFFLTPLLPAPPLLPHICAPTGVHTVTNHNLNFSRNSFSTPEQAKSNSYLADARLLLALSTGTTAKSHHQGVTGKGKGSGRGSHFRGSHLSFEEALIVARSLGLPRREEWKAWSKSGWLPTNVPSAPDTVYKHDGWQGWGHWLGTGNQAVPAV